MADKLNAGDKVSWNTSQGKTTGEVVRKLTRNTRIKGFEAKASKADPKYLVESSKTGARAAHASESLSKKS